MNCRAQTIININNLEASVAANEWATNDVVCVPCVLQPGKASICLRSVIFVLDNLYGSAGVSDNLLLWSVSKQCI